MQTRTRSVQLGASRLVGARGVLGMAILHVEETGPARIRMRSNSLWRQGCVFDTPTTDCAGSALGAPYKRHKAGLYLIVNLSGWAHAYQHAFCDTAVHRRALRRRFGVCAGIRPGQCVRADGRGQPRSGAGAFTLSLRGFDAPSETAEAARTNVSTPARPVLIEDRGSASALPGMSVSHWRRPKPVRSGLSRLTNSTCRPAIAGA